ncbi:type IV minor pilin protein PilW [Shewanella sairae]|uniref:Type IV minor pilin protein PilW n=1 Tax=Shewanella sairae TaxID=190310 RepID=A0ABQ4PE64_9GAMM|nr:PilW family protein [Shewanella sairae]MCL1128655.1 PilW family protein [Shewanella sairae]GIU45840.1 type IV minor pilin protein PilW [Shewanella sairae]
MKVKGFSLVELMVAMGVGLFLTAGVFTMFIMSAANVTTTSQFNQLQENGRIALALIERDVSQLGFLGDLTGTALTLGTNINIDAVPISASDDCIGGGVNNASFPTAVASNFRLLWGYESGVSAQSLTCLTNARTATDVLQIKRLSGPSIALPNDANRYYLAANVQGGTLFSGDQPAPFVINGRYWEYLHHIYYIEDEAGIPTLKRRVLRKGGMNTSSSFEQLVEGVENMRILYGFDSNGDNSADSFMPVQNVTSLMWDNSLTQRIVALRIFLLIRSIEDDSKYTNNNTYELGDKIIVAPGDNFRRKVISTTLVLENPLMTVN